MSLASFFERFAGEKNLNKNMKAVYSRGIGAWDQGAALQNEGLKGLRSLDADFMRQIAQGGTTDALRRSFAMQRGAIEDTGTRALGSLSDQIGQQRMRSGGNLSPEAAAELVTQGQAAIEDSKFGAVRDQNIAEAQISYEATRELQDRIMRIRESILGTGNAERDRGLDAMLQSLGLRFQRMKAIDESARSWASMGMSRK